MPENGKDQSAVGFAFTSDLIRSGVEFAGLFREQIIQITKLMQIFIDTQLKNHFIIKTYCDKNSSLQISRCS